MSGGKETAAIEGRTLERLGRSIPEVFPPSRHKNVLPVLRSRL